MVILKMSAKIKPKRRPRPPSPPKCPWAERGLNKPPPAVEMPDASCSSRDASFFFWPDEVYGTPIQDLLLSRFWHWGIVDDCSLQLQFWEFWHKRGAKWKWTFSFKTDRLKNLWQWLRKFEFISRILPFEIRQYISTNLSLFEIHHDFWSLKWP